jgi:SAM-dependent methyltransferase
MRVHYLRYVLLLCLIAAMSVACADLQSVPPPAPAAELDVPYVPTPPELVLAMLQLARVTRDDVLYDLGCGDGRIVITAAQKYGTRGTGVDLDPQRIREAQDHAREAGVTRRVRFLVQDLFTTDLHDATVVTLYLLPKVNLQLRPTLLRDLKPGTRVVSHAFGMDDWEPDRTIETGGTVLYLWIIPAQVAGTWTWTSPESPDPSTLQLTQHFQRVSGTLQAQGLDMPLTEVTLVGERLRFTALPQQPGRPGRLHFDGLVQGDTMVSHITTDGATPAPQQSRVMARRVATD